MIHSGNIIFMMGFTSLVMSLTAAVTVLLMVPYQGEWKNARNRKLHKQVSTNYQRLKAQLATTNGTIELERQ